MKTKCWLFDRLDLTFAMVNVDDDDGYAQVISLKYV